MMIQKITIPMDNPLDQGRRIIDQPQRSGIIMARKGSKINANEKIAGLPHGCQFT
jgi:hypothetical protein